MTEVTKEMLQAALEVDTAYAKDATGNLHARMYLAMRERDPEVKRLIEAERRATHIAAIRAFYEKHRKIAAIRACFKKLGTNR